MEICRAEFAQLGHILFGRSPKQRVEAAEAFYAEIEGLCERVGVPRRLSQVGVDRELIPAVVKNSRGAGMSGNPRELSDAELAAILEGLL
jgi:alcohol dehydrogenase class IV